MQVWMPSLIVLIPAVIALLLLYFDLRTKRNLFREEFNFKKTIHEAQQKEIEERREWLEKESVKLSQVSEPIAKNLKNELTKNVFWLSEAMSQANLGAKSLSLFSERLGHFKEEKKQLSEYFVKLLLYRCKHYIVEKNKPVCIIIDSGTTLYDFFEVFALETVSLYQAKESWIKELVIATNNLPGIQVLMEKGRINPNDRFSEIAINKCCVFPGEPLPIYYAITGAVTNEAVRQLRTDMNDAVIISITVGNWVRIRRSNPFCPVPLARGKGHLDFKQELINISDEVFVIAPLGKVFINVSLDEINNMLGLRSNHGNPDKEKYNELNINNEDALKVKLVSTYRPERKYLLYDHSIQLEALLKFVEYYSTETDKYFPIKEIEEIPHLLFPFNKLPDVKYFEIETEFPHKVTRKEEILSKYFAVKSIE